MSHTAWLSDLAVSEICFVNTYRAVQENYPIRKKKRQHHGFLFTVRGTEEYRFGERTVRAVPGSVLYIPKGESYTTTLEGEESEVVVMDFELSGETAGARPFCVMFPQGGAVGSCFSDAETSWERTVGYPVLCKSMIYKIASLMILQEARYLESDKEKKISEAVSYLHAHYLQNDFRVEQLYGIADVSPKYFGMLFFRKFGMTPKEYVLFLKIERAKKLLLSEKCSIRDIADQLGYSDIYHFSKIFKEKTGYTPSMYRNL